MATAGVPSGTILAVHLQKCSHLSNEIRVMQKKKSFSITKQLMPALKVNIIIVHPRGVVFPLLLTWRKLSYKTSCLSTLIDVLPSMDGGIHYYMISDYRSERFGFRFDRTM